MAPSGLGDSSRRMVGFTQGIADVVQYTGCVGLVCSWTRFQGTRPTRGHLDSIKRLVKGGLKICRGSASSRIHSKFAKFGRARAIGLFAKHLDDDRQLESALLTLSGLRLVCHCGSQQSCHADILITAFSRTFPDAFGRNDVLRSPPPTSDQLI